MSLLRMLLMLAIMMAVGFTYGVKDEVLAIQRDIHTLKTQIKQEETIIADYEAEWATKSAVPNLMRLATTLMPNTEPLTARHFRRPTDIPMRAVTPSDAEVLNP